MKIQISYVLKKFRSVFNENTYQFYVFKKIKSVFNENTDQFYELRKKNKFAFNENADKFLELKKKSDLKNSNMFYVLKKRIFDSRFLRLKRKIITTKYGENML